MNNNILSADNLSKQTVENLKNDIIEDTKQTMPDQLLRYAVIRSSEQAYADAKTAIIPEVIAQAQIEHAQEIADGKAIDLGFGLLFILITPQYDFSHKLEWKKQKTLVDQKKKELKALEIDLKAIEQKLIETDRIKPVGTKETVRLVMK